MKKSITLAALLLAGITANSYAQTFQVRNNRCFADVNGDGKSDYIVLSGIATKPSVSVYLSNGRNFNAQPVSVSSPVSGKMQESCYFADINGDGKADFVTLQGVQQTPKVVAYLAMEYGYSDEYKITSEPIDKGYDGLPRGFADINNDGRADYLTFRGDFKRPYIVAYLSTGDGFNMASFKSAALLEIATNPDVTRAFADINADGMADYMDSYNGNNVNTYLSTKIQYNYHFIYPNKTSLSKDINKGYDDMPRGFIDVDGDQRADYLTFRGNENYPRIDIHYSYGSRFEETPVKSHPVERGVDRGFADVNGDGKWDYVAFRGSGPNPKPIIYLSNGKDFVAPCEENTIISFYNDAAYNSYYTLRYQLEGEEHFYRSPVVQTNKRVEYKVPAEATDIEVIGYCNECYDKRRIFNDVIERSDCPSEICYRVYGDQFKKYWDFNGCSK